MKRPLMLLVVALVGCASLTAPYQFVSDIVASPDQFNGQAVRVCGWFESGMETCTLSKAESAMGVDILDEDAVWVTPSSDACTPLKAFNKPQATWAVVDGKFLTGGGYGHLGQYQHTLVGGTIRPVHGACTGGAREESIQSFKPKPLRGSAQFGR